MLVAPWITFYMAPWQASMLPNIAITLPLLMPAAAADAATAEQHPTGIPDDRVRRVDLDAGPRSRCQSFDIEQAICGLDTGSVLWSGSVVLASLI